MTANRYELHRIIDLLDEEDAENILKVLKKMIKSSCYDDTTLTSEESKRLKNGEFQIQEGQYVTLEDYKQQRGL